MIKRLALLIASLLCAASLQAATTQTAFATDNMTRANATTLGQNWANFASYGANPLVLCKITANAAALTSTSSACSAMYVGNDFPNDQYAQTTVTRILASGNNEGMPCVDAIPNIPAGTPAGSQGNTGPMNGYCVWVDGSNHYNINITKNNILSNPQLATSSTTPGTNDTILLTVQQVATGRQLTVFVNATQIIQTIDTANTFVAGFPAMYCNVDTTITDLAVTNFAAGAVSTPPTITNSGGATIILNPGPTQLGSITGTGQAVQFQTRSSGFNYLGRLQIIANGQVSNPIWVLECSQDGGNTWFQLPVITLPSLSPQLQDVPTGPSLIYDISGLGGAQFRFGLSPSTTTTVTGAVNVTAMTG